MNKTKFYFLCLYLLFVEIQLSNTCPSSHHDDHDEDNSDEDPTEKDHEGHDDIPEDISEEESIEIDNDNGISSNEIPKDEPEESGDTDVHNIVDFLLFLNMVNRFF